jgi:hypothetical protein
VPATIAAPPSTAVGRYVRCPSCAKTVIARAEVCPFCAAALVPQPPAAAQPVSIPRYDIVGGCLLAAMVFLAFVVFLLWLLGPTAPRG